ncbi:MAG: HAMP domain-containing protein, partial [Deltaproteobacteria bacterium]|nr:HAMP domain-containing protein [Deltaproteobacteria bacterium]
PGTGVYRAAAQFRELLQRTAMKLNPRQSIALKLTLLVLGVTSLVFTALLTYNYYYSRKIILAEAEKGARNLALSVARRIEQEFRAVEKIPEGVARQLEQNFPSHTLAFLALLRSAVTSNTEVFGCCVAFQPFAFDTEHRLYAPYFYKEKGTLQYAQLGTNEYDYLKRDWFHVPEVLESPVWTQPYFDEGGGNVMMVTYAAPFFELAPDGERLKVRGIVTADISLEWLTGLVGSITVGRTGRCFLISDTGAFITSPRPDMISRESVFSLAEEHGYPGLRNIGRSMIRNGSGFVDIGTGITGEESFLAYAQIPSTGWSLGAIFPKSELFEDVSRLHQETLVLAVVGLFALLTAGAFVARSITRPLRLMADATVKVAHGDLDVDLSGVRSRDEVGQLARAFTRMTEGLKERDFIRDTFGRYLTREVVNRLLESEDGLRLGGESREISMLMSDLRGFTALTSTMSPEQVITFLNRYLSTMLDILIDHRGTVDEIIGDGILAFFGAPESLEDHPARAVACALKMQAAMDEINEVNEKEGLPHLEMGVAVNTGYVVVGNIGSEKRAKYGAVGSQVNFTGRVESYTVGGQVLVSQSTHDRVRDIVDLKGVLRVTMKGIPGEVPLYDVIGIRGTHNVHLPESDFSPVLLKNSIEVRMRRLDEKIVADAETAASITHISMTSALLVLPHSIRQWENVRIHMLDPDHRSVIGEVYGKVVSVREIEGATEALVRLTSASPAAYAMIRKASNAA